jgi:hypothetical protein
MRQTSGRQLLTPSARLPGVARWPGALRVGRRKSGVLSAAAVAALAAAMAAQEGHPLVGTWRGQWGPSATERYDLTVVIEYDGRTISGVINPGFESMKLKNVVLNPSSDPDGWTVRFETEVKDKAGRVVPVAIDAKIVDITSRHRSLVGTWRQGDVKGDFKITLGI